MSIKLIAFDVDGTLFTSENILHEAYKSAVEDFNQSRSPALKVPELKEILAQIGNPGKVILRSLFGHLPEADAGALGSAIRARLITAIRAGRAALYPGVRETLEELRRSGYEMRLASNGNKEYIDAISAHYGLTPFVGPFTGLNNTDIRDKGDMLNLYKSILDIRGPEMVMVGDRKSDLEAARKADCFFVGFTAGHGARDELDAPGVVHIKRLRDLPAALMSLSAGNSPWLPL